VLPLPIRYSLLQEQLDFSRAQVASARVRALSIPDLAEVLTLQGTDDLFVWWPSLWASLTPG